MTLRLNGELMMGEIEGLGRELNALPLTPEVLRQPTAHAEKRGERHAESHEHCASPGATGRPPESQPCTGRGRL